MKKLYLLIFLLAGVISFSSNIKLAANNETLEARRAAIEKERDSIASNIQNMSELSINDKNAALALFKQDRIWGTAEKPYIQKYGSKDVLESVLEKENRMKMWAEISKNAQLLMEKLPDLQALSKATADDNETTALTLKKKLGIAVSSWQLFKRRHLGNLIVLASTLSGALIGGYAVKKIQEYRKGKDKPQTQV